jgi:SAM-dependent methyltransferase
MVASEYDRSARWYDKIYGFKDYAAEAEALRSLLEQHRPGMKRLLDVACGTGEHLRHLRAFYEVEGIDASPAMLEIARHKLPNVPFHLADMRTFDLGRTFDALICMFGAMGHLHDEAELHESVRRMAAHLTPGGVLIVEPWLTPEVFEPGRVSGLFVDEDELKLARMSVGRVEEGRAVLEMHHLVATPAGVESFVEPLSLTLFPHQAYFDALGAAGFQVRFDPRGPMGRGLFTATLPSSR